MDPKQKLLELFASTIEVRKTDFAQALATPAADLEAGRTQAGALFSGVVRLDPDEVDAGTAGRTRFPDLQGTAGLFAEGLARNPDIAEEIFAAPEVFTTAIDIDQAIGRFIYAGELLQRGGDTGEVLAGVTAQRLCDAVVDQARSRVTDPEVPGPVQSDISVVFEEPFRLQEELRLRQQQQQAVSDQAAQPYLDKIEQANQDAELTRVVEAFLKAVIRPGQPGQSGETTP